jgi:hypothetical protein
MLIIKKKREELSRQKARDEAKGKRVKETETFSDPSNLYENLTLIDRKEAEVHCNVKTATMIMNFNR